MSAPASVDEVPVIPLPVGRPARAEHAEVPARAGRAVVELPGGWFAMGSEDVDVNVGDGEGPVRRVRVDPFAIDACAVTNDDFARFVDATGYRTEAEELGWSFVLAAFLPAVLRAAGARVEGAPWWCATNGAWWREPEGPGSHLVERGNHPVVHVSWRDAEAFARWAGGRLPTEAQWEYAARGGLDGARYAWGDELTPDGVHRCNIWQGGFPVKNTAEDGYRGTAPVDAFEPNGFGLFNVAGNVWEMCADRWGVAHGLEPLENPSGPTIGAARVIRGGSYLWTFAVLGWVYAA